MSDQDQRAFERLIPTLDAEQFESLLTAVVESAKVRAWIEAEEACERGDTATEIDATLRWSWALEEARAHLRDAAEREGRVAAPMADRLDRAPASEFTLLGCRVWRHG